MPALLNPVPLRDVRVRALVPQGLRWLAPFFLVIDAALAAAAAVIPFLCIGVRGAGRVLCRGADRIYGNRRIPAFAAREGGVVFHERQYCDPVSLAAVWAGRTSRSLGTLAARRITVTRNGPIRILYCEHNVDGTVGGSYYSLSVPGEGAGPDPLPSRSWCSTRRTACFLRSQMPAIETLVWPKATRSPLDRAGAYALAWFTTRPALGSEGAERAGREC